MNVAELNLPVIYKNENPYFYLTPFTKELSENNYKNWWLDQEVTKYNSHGLFPMTTKELNSFLNDIESNKIIVWAIIVQEQINDNYYEKHIGNISLQNINWINRSAEFAVVIGEKDYWNKGYTTKAIRYLINHGFNKLNLNRIWTGTSESNIGMQKVAEKLNMTKEGKFKQGMFLNGQYENVYCYSILKEK